VAGDAGDGGGTVVTAAAVDAGLEFFGGDVEFRAGGGGVSREGATGDHLGALGGIHAGDFGLAVAGEAAAVLEFDIGYFGSAGGGGEEGQEEE